MTIRDELAAGITARGGKLVSKDLKRWKFQHPRNPASFYWLGVSGSMRCGSTVETSISLTDGYVYRNIRAEGAKAIAKAKEEASVIPVDEAEAHQREYGAMVERAESVRTPTQVLRE